MPIELEGTILGYHPIFAGAALVLAALAAVLLIWFLVAKPALTGAVKIVLLLAVGALPIAAAVSGNVAGFEHTTTTEFCGSCHVMEPYAKSSRDLESGGLAAIHGQNEEFGGSNCYACHKDYDMFGAITTKIGGFNHMRAYYGEYWRTPLEEALPEFEIYEPYPNENCMYCHSTELPSFEETPDHAALMDEVRAGEVSCVGSGCHGPAHPFTKEGGAFYGGDET